MDQCKPNYKDSLDIVSTNNRSRFAEIPPEDIATYPPILRLKCGYKVVYLSFLGRAYLIPDGAVKSKRPVLKDDTTSWPSRYLPKAPSILDQSEGGITVQLTKSCNLACKYCYADSNTGSKLKLIDTGFVKDIISTKIGAGRKSFSTSFFGGGEPTLAFPQIQEIHAFIRSKVSKTYFSIQTNGVVPEEKLDWIMGNIDHIAVSCDGPQHIHDRQRPFPNGAGSHGQVERTLRTLVENKKDVVACIAVSAYSAGMQEEIVDYFHSLGVKNMRVGFVIPTSRSQSDGTLYSKSPNLDIFAKHLFRSMELADDYGITIQADNYPPLFKIGSQFCGSLNYCLTLDNHISSCYRVLDKDSPGFSPLTYGKYEKGRVILSDKKIKALLERNAYSLKPCKRCFLRWNCAGYCMYDAAMLTGNALMPSQKMCRRLRDGAKTYISYKIARHLQQLSHRFEHDAKGTHFKTFFKKYSITGTAGKEWGTYLSITEGTDLKACAEEILQKRSKGQISRLLLLSSNTIGPQVLDGFLEFFNTLKRQGLNVRLTKPVCRHMLRHGPGLPGAPKNCKECLELFIVQKNGTLRFCDGTSSSKTIEEYINRDEVYGEFTKGGLDRSTHENCASCIFLMRENCGGVCAHCTDQKVS